MEKKVKISFQNLKRIAYNKVKKDPATLEELEEFLKDWWSDKFNLPDNHPLLLEKTFEELLIMYFKDTFRNEDGEETKDYEIREGIRKSDEDWFRKQMGEEEYNNSKTLNSSRDEQKIGFEEKFDVLGE